jgi:hypothetical protein
MHKITKDIKETVIQLYITEKHSLRDIAKIVGICRPTVRKILREAGVRNVYKKDIEKCNNLNHNYFDQIDTEDKAYFLGLLFADGNNYVKSKNRKYYTISIVLQERDKKILEKMRDTIAPGYNLYFYKPKNKNCQNTYKLSIRNKHLSDQLSSLGCVPAKSLILKFPNHNIFKNKNLIKHFIRGYFDGDGCLGIYNLKKNYKKF